jgi:hypothetical protein
MLARRAKHLTRFVRFSLGLSRQRLRSRRIPVRVKSNFANPLNHFAPLSPPASKILLYELQNWCISLPIPPLRRGTLRPIVTKREAGCDGRESCETIADRRGRRSRVVLSPRRWGQADRDDRSATGASKPGTPRRARRTPLKPLRREGRVASVEPVVTMRVWCFPFPPPAAGAASIRLSLRPLHSGGFAILHHSGKNVPRECGVVPKLRRHSGATRKRRARNP